MSKIVRAHRFALDPSAAQELALRSHCGAQRFAYNWGWTAYALRTDWNVAKDEVVPWWGENSKEASSSGLANLATALTNWHNARNGERKSRRLGFPRFKGKRAVLSCRFTTGAFGLASSHRGHVRLPRIGAVRTHESTRKLARHVHKLTTRQTEYKTTWAGVHLHVADRWYPSSKTCSACGVVKAKLRLSERTHHCNARGFTLDRDLNAARNLAGLVEASSPSRGATENEPTGNPRQTRTTRATGTATGRPAPPGSGQRRHGNASAQDTCPHVS